MYTINQNFLKKMYIANRKYNFYCCESKNSRIFPLKINSCNRTNTPKSGRMDKSGSRGMRQLPDTKYPAVFQAMLWIKAIFLF